MFNNKIHAIMKKISKKEYRSILTNVACGLIKSSNHNVIDKKYASQIWEYIARTALLEYPIEDLKFWQIQEEYITNLCKTIK